MRYFIMSMVFFILGFGKTAWTGGGALFDVDSAQVASNLENYFRQAEDAAAKHQIRLVRQQSSLIEFKIEKYSALIDKIEKKTYTSRLSGLNALVKRTIDSLVQVNLVILRKNGTAAGIEFRQKCASEGLSETELAPVDEAIVNVSASDERTKAQMPANEPQPTQVEQPRRPESAEIFPKKDSTPVPIKTVPPPISPAPPIPPTPPPSPPEPALSKTVPSIVPSPQPGPDITVKASPPPATERDQGKARAVSTATKVFGLVNEGKIEEAMTVFNIYQANLRQFLSPADFEQLKSAVNNAYAQDQDRRVRVQQAAHTIDDLVDQNRSAEAFALLRTKHDELKQNMSKDEFDRLETKVGRANVEFGKSQGSANMRAREIRILLSDQKVDDASTAFEKSRLDLQRYLSKDAFEGLRLEVINAVNAIRDKKKQSLVCMRDIRSLIKEGNGAAAYSRFMENRPLLEQHLDEKSFASLASDVGRAKNDFFTRQSNAQAELTRIDSLIACKRIEAAWDRFKQSKDAIRKDLADDKRYFELKDRVGQAYDNFSDNKKRALKSERRIVSLIKDRQGRDAYMSFRLDASLLAEYLEPGRCKQLENEVQRAYADYESNVAAARLAATDIEGLLANKQIEEAYSAFKKAELLFDRFLNGDKLIEDLEKKVKAAWAEHQKHKQRASSIVREIRWFIDHDQGGQAYAQFKKARSDLVGYIDPKKLAELDSASAHANDKFFEAKMVAEKNASRVRLLLDQKRFVDAYRLFKDLRGSLEEHLSETSFNNLRNEVTNAYEEYEGKKKRAEDYAKQLKFLVSRKKNQEAYAGFQENRASLKQYLSAKDFSKLEKIIVRKNAASGAKASKKK